jgi:hypothetical protein
VEAQRRAQLRHLAFLAHGANGMARS